MTGFIAKFWSQTLNSLPATLFLLKACSLNAILINQQTLHKNRVRTVELNGSTPLKQRSSRSFHSTFVAQLTSPRENMPL